MAKEAPDTAQQAKPATPPKVRWDDSGITNSYANEWHCSAAAERDVLLPSCDRMNPPAAVFEPSDVDLHGSILVQLVIGDHRSLLRIKCQLLAPVNDAALDGNRIHPCFHIA